MNEKTAMIPGAVIALIGLAVAYFGFCKGLWLSHESITWPQLEATVIEAKTGRLTSSTHGGKMSATGSSSSRYIVSLVLGYQVDGRLYQRSHRLHAASESEAKRKASELRLTTLPLKFDPADPSTAVVEPTNLIVLAALFVAGSVTIGGGVVFSLYFRHEVRRSRGESLDEFETWRRWLQVSGGVAAVLALCALAVVL